MAEDDPTEAAPRAKPAVPPVPKQPGPVPLDIGRVPLPSEVPTVDPEASTVLRTAVTERMPLGSGRPGSEDSTIPDGPPPATWIGRGVLVAVLAAVGAAYALALG